MVVAAAAFEREPEKRRAKRRHTVVDRVDAILLLDRSTFALLLVKPVERRGQKLLVGGAGQQITGQLPERKLVVRQVLVEGRDHPVTPRPHRGPLAVDLKAVAVGVAGKIHPVGGHPFAVVWARKQPIE